MQFLYFRRICKELGLLETMAMVRLNVGMEEISPSGRQMWTEAGVLHKILVLAIFWSPWRRWHNYWLKKKQIYMCVCVYIYQFSRSVVSNSLQPHRLQHTRPPCPSPTPRVYSDSCPSSRWCHPTISSSVVPAPNCSQHQSLFQWVNSLHEVAKVLECQLQHQSFQWTPRTDLL